MKPTTILVLTTLWFSCNSNQQPDSGLKTDRTGLQVDGPKETDTSTQITSEQPTDIFCDSTKIPNHRKNLKLIAHDLPNTQFQDGEAKKFIEHACANDSLFCDGIQKIASTSYGFNEEWTLNLVGYALGPATGMEENSASFFVLTIHRNGQVWFSDILSDLMGEVKVSLQGFEEKDRQVRVWGEIYPYFKPDYGKFELTIKNGTGLYEYQCHAQH